MTLFDIERYINDGIYPKESLKIEIKEPRLDLLDIEKSRGYTKEEVEAILGIKFYQDDTFFPVTYISIVSLGIRLGIFSKWLKIVKPIKTCTTKYLHKKDLDSYTSSKVFPVPSKTNPIEYLIKEIINENFYYKRRPLIERMYWIKRLLIENGLNPDLISFEKFEKSLTEKEMKEWLFLNLDLSNKTRSEIVRLWRKGDWRKLNGRLIKRCSMSMFRWEGNGPLIRFKKLPLIGYEEYINS